MQKRPQPRFLPWMKSKNPRFFVLCPEWISFGIRAPQPVFFQIQFLMKQWKKEDVEVLFWNESTYHINISKLSVNK